MIGIMTPLAQIDLDGFQLDIRRAAADDVPRMVALMRDDPVGAARDHLEGDVDLAPFRAAFASIEANPRALLVVAEVADLVVGMAQLTELQSLGRGGVKRGEVESVRVAADWQGRGIGTALLEWARDEAKRRGCVLLQLTSDKRRVDAIRFYEQFGFHATHEGLKLIFD
jgi:GNAT superfamily N-acetyltransferase